MDRRHFLKGLLATTAGLIVEEAIQVNRVYFFPQEIKLYKPADVEQVIGQMTHLRYDVTKEQYDAAMRGEISWETLKSGRAPVSTYDFENREYVRGYRPTLINDFIPIRGPKIESSKDRKIILTDD